MNRLYVVVEGATEETFVSELLAPHLLEHGISVRARRLGKPGHKGGRVGFVRAKKDVCLVLKGDRRACCTTLFDLYGLGEGWWQCAEAPAATGAERRAQAFEAGLHRVVVDEMGHTFHPDRFVAYLQMHEFEALLFSAPRVLADTIDRSELGPRFEGIRLAFASPEGIDDSPSGAPSKRIVALVPKYEKVVDGNLAARAIGLDAMRQQCPRFNAWVRRLEAFGVMAFS